MYIYHRDAQSFIYPFLFTMLIAFVVSPTPVIVVQIWPMLHIFIADYRPNLKSVLERHTFTVKRHLLKWDIFYLISQKCKHQSFFSLLWNFYTPNLLPGFWRYGFHIWFVGDLSARKLRRGLNLSARGQRRGNCECIILLQFKIWPDFICEFCSHFARFSLQFTSS